MSSGTSTTRQGAEVRLEDDGSTSVLRRVGTILSSQHGTLPHRFVARRDGVEGEVVASSPTFPVLAGQLPLDDVDPRSAFHDDVIAALDDLDESMRAAGWHRDGRGDHWWSRRYSRVRDEPRGFGGATP